MYTIIRSFTPTCTFKIRQKRNVYIDLGLSCNKLRKFGINIALVDYGNLAITSKFFF